MSADQCDWERAPGHADNWAWDHLCDVLREWAEEPIPDEPEEGWASHDLTRNHPREALAARMLAALGLPADTALPLTPIGGSRNVGNDRLDPATCRECEGTRLLSVSELAQLTALLEGDE